MADAQNAVWCVTCIRGTFVKGTSWILVDSFIHKFLVLEALVTKRHNNRERDQSECDQSERDQSEHDQSERDQSECDQSERNQSAIHKPLLVNISKVTTEAPAAIWKTAKSCMNTQHHSSAGYPLKKMGSTSPPHTSQN
jgi:hypothetical protein